MNRIIKFEISESDMEIIRRNANEAQIGGRSQVRGFIQREQEIGVDQLVGQTCEAAAVMYLTGSLKGYLAARDVANANKYQGDGGRDVIGLPVDIKGSLMRSGGIPEDYRLLVRPKERHDNWVYLLALVKSLEPPVTVFLCGWTRDSALPPADTEGPFSGAHVVWADDLRPIQKLQKVVRRFWEAKCYAANDLKANTEQEG